MAASPRWKVYSLDGEYLASCKYTEDAAVLVSANGHGAEVRDGHRGMAVWIEGVDGRAGESYDVAAAVMRKLAGIDEGRSR